MKNICYIGSGYVGQVDAVASAYYGHNVWLVDVIQEKVDSINLGKPTIFEEGLDEQLYNLVINENRLQATMDLEEAIRAADVSFICVGTPDKGEMIDLSYIRQVAIGIGKALQSKDEYHVVVVKSTVVPGTTLNVVKPLLEQYSGKIAGVDFGLAMNPEFLREGVALEDCLHPDSIVLGTQDDRTQEILTDVYSWAKPEILTYVGITAAEAIKYAKNTFLAMKITFANEWANFCEKIGVDVKQVMDAIGKDHRVGPYFLRNGPGYGGSCFPKDVNAILHEGNVQQSPFRIMETVVHVNSNQYLHLVQLAERIIGKLDGKRFGVLGLSFKPNTDDTRESPALQLINYLVVRGCEVKAFAPKG